MRVAPNTLHCRLIGQVFLCRVMNEYFTSFHYDVIVLDIMLPNRDGWSVLTEIRRRQQRH